MLDLVGVKTFCVKLVLLFYKGIGKRREELVRNRENCEPIALIVISTIVEVVVIILTQTLLVILVVALLSCRWNNASENLTSTKKYKDLIAEGLVFMCDATTALLICVN
jgi:hypothetical protein